MKIEFSNDIGDTPAIVRRDTGVIKLNKNTWFTFPEAYRRFILAHEIGHYALQTTNELEADHYAFCQIAGTFKDSLKNTVRTLHGVLPFDTELQKLRLINMLRLSLTYDQFKQPTGQRMIEIKRLETEMKTNYAYHPQLIEYMSFQTTKHQGYDFPGYDQSLFEPSVGRYFHDIPKVAPWPTGQIQFTQPILQAAPATATTTSNAGTVTLDLLPNYAAPFKLDLKTLAIVVLVILAIIALKKL